MQKLKLGANIILFGENAIEALSELDSKTKKVLIVESGKILQEVGYEQELMDILSKNGFEFSIFDQVGPEPTFTDIRSGVELAKELEPDWIIGFGGGSAMDAAKLIWVMYENPEIDSITKLSMPSSIKKLREKAKLCCIATTAGTGSEVTRAAVFTDEASKKKIAVADSVALRLVPDIAVLDAHFTMTMPSFLTASTGMDVITHAVESYLSCKANIFSESLSMAAFKIAYENLPNSYAYPKEYSYKENMLAASSLAGIAFSNSGLGVCHSLAHVIGAKLKVAHGMANAILLPYVIELLNGYDCCKLKIGKLEDAIETSDLSQAIRQLNDQLNIPNDFTKFIDSNYHLNDHIDELITLAIDDSNTKNSPVKLTRNDFEKIINQVFNK